MATIQELYDKLQVNNDDRLTAVVDYKQNLEHWAKWEQIRRAKMRPEYAMYYPDTPTEPAARPERPDLPERDDDCFFIGMDKEAFWSPEDWFKFIEREILVFYGLV